MRAASLLALSLIVPLIAGAHEQAEEGPSIRIVAPEDGSTVPGPDVEVVLVAEGVAIGGERGTGGYVLLRMDELPPVRVYAETFVFQGTAPGDHVLAAELRRTDGSRFDPPVEHAVRFAVSTETPPAVVAAANGSASSRR